jgi:superoxide oxidase
MSSLRYHRASIVLHWLVFLLIVAAFITIELKGQFPKGTEARELCKSIHGVFGQLIFIAMLLRLAIRLKYGVPKPIGTSTLLNSLAQAMHCLFYALILITPIFGILYFQYAGKEIHFFGLIWPQFVTPSVESKKLVEAIHEFLGNSLYFLIGIHALAGLWHHYVFKDDTLRRMLNKVKAST